MSGMIDRQSAYLLNKKRVSVVADSLSLQAYDRLAKDFYSSDLTEYEVIEPTFHGKQKLWEEGIKDARKTR